MLYQVAQMGEALAKADIQRHRDAAYHARQIRLMAQNRILEASAVRGAGPTSAKLYSYDTLLIARIVSELVEIKLPVSAQQLAAQALYNKPGRADFAEIFQGLRARRLPTEFEAYLRIASLGTGYDRWAADLSRLPQPPQPSPYPLWIIVDLPNILAQMPEPPADDGVPANPLSRRSRAG